MQTRTSWPAFNLFRPQEVLMQHILTGARLILLKHMEKKKKKLVYFKEALYCIRARAAVLKLNRALSHRGAICTLYTGLHGCKNKLRELERCQMSYGPYDMCGLIQGEGLSYENNAPTSTLRLSQRNLAKQHRGNVNSLDVMRRSRFDSRLQ
ncbi:hypothetical protein NL108_008936 [Boleophthalmus pectinirostris]|nr:hypothetical protein NL108_008936 [Boleophthalmus pectinirostris]